jgi:outer membrane receptor protein involved in Fe transport
VRRGEGIFGVFIKNLANKQYLTSVASVYAKTGSSGQTIGDPRRFGVSLSYSFCAMADR